MTESTRKREIEREWQKNAPVNLMCEKANEENEEKEKLLKIIAPCSIYMKLAIV